MAQIQDPPEAHDPPELQAAINAYPSTPGQAIEQLKPLADTGNRRALAALTTFMMLQNQQEEALPYVRRALELGLGAIGQMYANDFAGRRPELRMQVPEFISVALDSGWSVDYRTMATQAAQGDAPDLFGRLLDVISAPRPISIAEQWERLITKTEAEGERIAQAASEVAARRDEAIQKMADGEDHVASRQVEVDRVVNELGVVVSEAGAHALANAYAEEAKRTHKQASRYTGPRHTGSHVRYRGFVPTRPN